MNLFAAVVPKESALVSRFRDAVDGVAREVIPFFDQPHEKVVWTNGQVLVVSFSIHAKESPIGSYTAGDASRFVTFNGMPLFGQASGDERSWAAQLLAREEAGGLDRSRLGGYYNLLTVEGEAVAACNCLVRAEPMYWTQTTECIVVGNRASLVSGLARRSTRFAYEPRALITLCTTGWQVNDLTPFRDVKVLDNGSCALVRPGRMRETVYKPYAYQDPDAEDEATQVALAERLGAALLDGVRVFSAFREPLTVNLSGGKDSRIMAALCAQAGIPFRCVTSGQPEDREVIVARQVAEMLGAEHELSPVRVQEGVPEVDVFALLRQHVTQGDGMTSVHDPTYPVRLRANVMLAGHGGECYRGGYDMVRVGSRPLIEGRERALRFLRDLNLCNQTTFLRDEAVHEQEALNEEIVDVFRGSGFPWHTFYDYAYTKYREGRGVANLRQAAAYGAFAFSPYLNDHALRMGWRFPLEQRKSDWLYFRLLDRLDRRLARLRFSDSRWKFEQDGPGPGMSQAEWEAREPLPPTPRAQGAHSWRLGFDGALRSPIREYLLDRPGSRVFEVVDYRKLEQVLRAEPPTAPGILRSLYGILTVAYFLNDDWRRDSE